MNYFRKNPGAPYVAFVQSGAAIVAIGGRGLFPLLVSGQSEEKQITREIGSREIPAMKKATMGTVCNFPPPDSSCSVSPFLSCLHMCARERALFLLANVKEHIVEHVTLGTLDFLCRGREASQMSDR